MKTASLHHLRWLIPLSLAAVTILSFLPVQNGQFVYDDYDYLTKNRHVQDGLTLQSFKWAWTATHSANWHPLTWLSHILDIELFGFNPAGHHMVNVLFHILNVLLLFYLFKRLTGSRPLSFLIAALFAIHPLHVESVAWISERKDVLSVFFALLCLHSYIRYAATLKNTRFARVVLSFVLALMAKPMMVTLPFVMLLLDYWPLNRIKSLQPAGAGDIYPKLSFCKLILEKLPLFILTAISCVITYHAQQKGGAMTMGMDYPFAVRLLNSFNAYIFYIVKTFAPVNLAVLYPHPGKQIALTRPIVSLIILLAITAVVVYRIRKQPALAVGWLWFLGTLVPVIGLVQVGNQAHADRYSYFPSIGLYIAILWAARSLIAKIKIPKVAVSCFCAVVVLVLAVLTYRQAAVWQDHRTLFGRAIEITQDNPVAYNNYGLELLKDKRYKQAIDCFQKATDLRTNYQDAYSNLGLAYQRTDRPQEALQCYQKAIEIEPRFFDAQRNIALLYKEMDNRELASRHFHNALSLRSYDHKLREIFAGYLLEQNMMLAAARQYAAVLKDRPDDPDILNNLAWIHATANDPKLKNPQIAIDFAQKACQLTDHNKPELLDTLAVAYAAASQFQQAVNTQQRAIQIAESQDNPQLADQLKTNLKLFTQNKPWQPQ